MQAGKSGSEEETFSTIQIIRTVSSIICIDG